MRRILIAAAAACLAGCATPARFDATEQLAYATLWQQAWHLEQACSGGPRSPAAERARLGAMATGAELLGAYLEYQADTGSREILRAFTELLVAVGDVSGRSAAYCRESAANLQEAAGRALQVNGGRRR